MYRMRRKAPVAHHTSARAVAGTQNMQHRICMLDEIHQNCKKPGSRKQNAISSAKRTKNSSFARCCSTHPKSKCLLDCSPTLNLGWKMKGSMKSCCQRNCTKVRCKAGKLALTMQKLKKHHNWTDHRKKLTDRKLSTPDSKPLRKWKKKQVP